MWLRKRILCKKDQMDASSKPFYTYFLPFSFSPFHAFAKIFRNFAREYISIARHLVTFYAQPSFSISDLFLSNSLPFHPLQKMEDEAITEFVRLQLTLPNELDPSDELNWQHHLYSTLGNKDSAIGSQMKPEALDFLIRRIVAMGKVLYGLHMIDHPAVDHKASAPKVVSVQRKRAVIACFRQTSLHSLPRHSAINLFLRTYRELWLSDENVGQEVLIDHLTVERD